LVQARGFVTQQAMRDWKQMRFHHGERMALPTSLLSLLPAKQWQSTAVLTDCDRSRRGVLEVEQAA
jgi:hypothetical protein